MDNKLSNRYKIAVTFINDIEGFNLSTNANGFKIDISNKIFLTALIRDDDSKEVGDISEFYNLSACPYYLLITNNFIWFKNQYDKDFKQIITWNNIQEDFVKFVHSCLVERFDYQLRKNLRDSGKYMNFSDSEKLSKELLKGIETFMLFVNSKSLTSKALEFDTYNNLKKYTLELLKQIDSYSELEKDLFATKPFLAYLQVSFSEEQKKYFTTLNSKSVDINIMPNGDLLLRLRNLVYNEGRKQYGYDSDGFENLIPEHIHELSYVKLTRSGMTENVSLVEADIAFLPYKYFLKK